MSHSKITIALYSLSLATTAFGFITVCPTATANPTSWEEVRAWKFEIEAQIPNADGSPRPGKRYLLRKIIAAAETDQFYHYVGHHYEGDPWDLEPRNQETVISNGVRFHNWRFNRLFSIRPMMAGDSLPGTLSFDTFFLVVPTWPISAYQVPHDPATNTIFIISSAIQSGKYLLVAERELLNGEQCLRYQSSDGADTIWLANEEPLCLLRREIRHSKTGVLLQCIIVTKVKEVSRGLWMPVKYQSMVFDSTRGDAELPIRRAHFTVLDYDLSSSRQLFQPKIAPGSIRSVDSDGSIQVTSDGTDLIQEIVTHFRSVNRLPNQNLDKASWRRGVLSFFAGLLFVDSLLRFSKWVRPKLKLD